MNELDGNAYEIAFLPESACAEKKVNDLQFMAHGHGAKIRVDKFEKRKKLLQSLILNSRM